MFEKQILCRGSENISGAETTKRLRISEPRSCERLLGAGASDPIRTGDLLITSELLYLLSHTSITHILYNRSAGLSSARREIDKAQGTCYNSYCQGGGIMKEIRLIPALPENGLPADSRRDRNKRENDAHRF